MGNPVIAGRISVLLAAVCLLSAAPATNGNDQAGIAVVEIDGAKLTLADLAQKQPVTLFQARNTFYQAERKIVDDAIDDYLLARQAEREHLTVDELLDRHVNKTLPPDPSEESLRVYYLGVNTTEPFESVRGQILDHIREIELEKARAAYLKSLRAEAHVLIRLTPPRLEVSLRNTPLRGPADAPVVLVEYADYECPICQQAQPAVDRLEKEYKGRIAFAYKDVPLSMHPHAQKAAEAAHCAGAQGKFWEYHDILFRTKQLDISDLKQDARTLNLDSAAFDKCLESGAQAELVKEELEEGRNLELKGTPSFLLNGRFFSGQMPYDQLRGLVEEELSISAATRTQTAQR